MDAETKKTYPWEIEFMNLMSEGEYTLELMHSNSCYVWILPGTTVKHITDFGHRFDLRNFTHAVVATMLIENSKDEL